MEEVEVEKDVGVMVANNLKPSQQFSAAAGKVQGQDNFCTTLQGLYQTPPGILHPGMVPIHPG